MNNVLSLVASTILIYEGNRSAIVHMRDMALVIALLNCSALFDEGDRTAFLAGFAKLKKVLLIDKTAAIDKKCPDRVIDIAFIKLVCHEGMAPGHSGAT